jgi:hypothetical protein
MKRTIHAEEQMIGTWQEHRAGAKDADLCRKHWIFESTFFVLKAKYSGITVSESYHG